MPSSNEILAGLGTIANDAFAVAVLWHIVIAIVVAALAAGWRPSERVAGALGVALVTSVSASAWSFGNVFNGAVFAALAAVLIAVTWSAPRRPIVIARSWRLHAGAALVAFGAVYPHFLEGRPAIAYLIGAPVGLVPCPTLAVVMGAALAGVRPSSGAWRIALLAVGVFYALFGWLRLGVAIDVALLAAVAALLASAPRRSEARPAAHGLAR